jgi:hypothetical protein
MHDTLLSLVERAIARQVRPLEFYLREHSRLPGSRVNLELADDVAHLLARVSIEQPERVQDLIRYFVRHEQNGNPGSTPDEFIVLCGVVALGVCAVARIAWREEAFVQLEHFACSSSWCVREGVATAYQHLLEAYPQPTLIALRQLAASGNFLQQRAAVVAVAEPKLLYTAEMQAQAFDLQKIVLGQIPQVPVTMRKREDFKILRRVLGFTLSVITAADPRTGFTLMRECAVWKDEDVNWILRENLKKKRLARFKQDTASVLELLP